MAGAPNAYMRSNVYQGAVYAFQADGWLKENRTQNSKFAEAPGATYNGFGAAVSVRGSTVAVGTSDGLVLPPTVPGAALYSGREL